MYTIKFLNGTTKTFETLQGADLRNANLRNANLRYADLSGANLDFCDTPTQRYLIRKGACTEARLWLGGRTVREAWDHPDARTDWKEWCAENGVAMDVPEGE